MLTLLIDGKNSLYRHNYTSNLNDSNGNKVSGIYGMFNEVTKLVKTFNPSNVVIAWDSGKSRERCKLYPEYKAHRKKDDKELLENLAFQTKYAKLLFNCLPVKQITIEGVEADDVIGYLVKKLKGKKIIYSNDSDFYQLIDEDVSQFSPKKKLLITNKNVETHLGFNKDKYVLWKALVGDSSDNIEGVKGIGAMTATKLIKKEKQRKFTEEEKNIINRNIKLIKIGNVLNEDDIRSITLKYREQKDKQNNTALLRKLFIQLGFKSILSNFSACVYVYKELSRSNYGQEKTN